LVATVISPEQCRAARAWLDWKQQDLAREAGVSLSTVRDFEKGRRTPIANNARALVSALERAGMRLTFTSAGAPKSVEKKDL
jgi:DNA-binding transcriptional regulator YiaG